jgi:translation initiation factor IF-3
MVSAISTDIYEMRVLMNLHFYFFKSSIPFWRWHVISREHQINDEIRAREVRLVGADGEQIGIKSIRDALQLATEANLDLVNVAPTAKPPVCRIMDYGKFRYEQQKKEKEARKNQKIVDLKEVWFRANIEEHDYQVKFRNVVKFLNEGDKVKASVRFRGREITHASIGQKILERLSKEVAEICNVERAPKLEGRSMIMILAPKTNS